MKRIKLINSHLLRRIRVTCPSCTGDGDFQVEKPQPQNFSRDIGEMDIITKTCTECNGTGEVEMDDCDLELDNEEQLPALMQYEIVFTNAIRPSKKR